MIRTFFWAVWLFAYFISLTPVYWKVRRLEKRSGPEAAAEHNALVQKQVKLWTTRLLRNIGLAVTVEGAENLPGADETVVFVVNHQSYLDIPVVLGSIGRAYPLLGKRQLGKIPFLGAWMRRLGCIFVERDDARASVAALRACDELVEKGSSLIIFPEGTRSGGDVIGEFKGGAMRVALKAKVPVVPIVLNGTGRAMEGNNWRLRKGRVRVQVLPPVPTAELSRAEQKALPKYLENMMRTAQEKPWDPEVEKSIVD